MCTRAPKVTERHKNLVPESFIILVSKLPSCDLVVFINMNNYINTEGNNFKTFSKEGHAFALDSCYISTKKC